MMTFAEAQAEVQQICQTDKDRYIAMRQEARLALEADVRDYPDFYEGGDIGSSDVSIKMIEMVRFGEMEV